MRYLVIMLVICWPPLGWTQSAPPATRAPAQTSTGVCLLADFRALALTTHDPQLRMDAALGWLSQHARHCNIDQLKMLNNYRASWMGSSDHPKVQGMIDSLIEARASDDPKKLQELFSPTVPPPPPVETVGITVKPNPILNQVPAYPGGYVPPIQGYIQVPLPGQVSGAGVPPSPVGGGAGVPPPPSMPR